VEFVSVAFLVAGLVAVVARFGAGGGPVRLPGFIDRSIGMYLIRRLRGALDPDDLADADADADAPGAAPVAAGPAVQPMQAAASAPPESTRSGPGRRDLTATPARLAAIGARRPEPIRGPAARRPISLGARSMAAARLAPLPAPPFWRRLARDRRVHLGLSGPWKQAELTMAAVMVVVALVAVVGFAGQPSPGGGVLASTGRPQATRSGDVGPPSAAPASPTPSRGP
jgi:hypothetical protein